MANTARLAPWRFDTISLIKIVLCFYLALAPALSHASAAPNLIFNNVSNLVKTGAGIVADYAFKRGNASNDPNYNAANDNYYKKNHAVSNNQMGKVWRNRWAGLSNGIGGGLLATAAIAGILAAADWILDPANNSIKRLLPPSAPDYLMSATSPNGVFCSGSTVGEIQICLQAAVSSFRMNVTVTNPIGEFNPSLASLSAGQSTSAFPYFDFTRPSQGYPTWQIGLAYTLLGPSVDQYEYATDSDIAAAVAQADVDTLQQLATSPDYILEQHAPTIAAAAAAEPETTTTPEPDKSTLGTKVETTTTTNPDGSKTTTTTTTPLNPNGTPALNPDGTPQTPHVQTTTTKPDGSTTTTTNGAKPADTKPPIFCDWAKTLCSWLDWTKAEPAAANPAQNKVDIKDRDTGDIPGLPTAIDTTRIQWAQVCPAPITANFSLMGQSVGMSYKFDVVCDFAAKFRPYVIGLSYLTAAYIVMGLNRTRSE